MQLIIKLYKDKPARMGIIYPTEFQAGKAFEPIIDNNKNETFRAIIELLNGRANITLTSINGSAKLVYKACEFKIDQLKMLQTFVGAGSVIHFFHVYWKGNDLYRAKVRFKNTQPLLIHDYEIF